MCSLLSSKHDWIISNDSPSYFHQWGKLLRDFSHFKLNISMYLHWSILTFSFQPHQFFEYVGFYFLLFSSPTFTIYWSMEGNKLDNLAPELLMGYPTKAGYHIHTTRNLEVYYVLIRLPKTKWKPVNVIYFRCDPLIG